MVDKECLDCRHHKNGCCDTWCDSGEAWTPLKKNEYKKIVHAKWILGGYDDYYWVCSHCNHKRSEYYAEPKDKFCGECGATMDLE